MQNFLRALHATMSKIRKSDYDVTIVDTQLFSGVEISPIGTSEFSSEDLKAVFASRLWNAKLSFDGVENKMVLKLSMNTMADPSIFDDGSVNPFTDDEDEAINGLA